MNNKTKQFIEDIEELVWNHDIDYMDAIILYCNKNNIELESIVTIIKNNALLKGKLQEEGRKLNLLSK